jgi:ABC-type transporter Mla MlaB component
MINLSVTPNAETACVDLAGDLTIYTIADAKKQLMSVMNSALDLFDIAEFDGAGLQLLMALCRDGKNHVVNPSEAVLSVLSLTGQMSLLEGNLSSSEES